MTASPVPASSGDPSPPPYEGRLELTWTNKHLRLLAHDDGRYEWLTPSDYRVAEVRLLHDVEAVGEVGTRRAADNLLIRGDALHALTSLTKLPEFAREYLGKVQLVYIDPPFNTGQAFADYDDALEHSVWLTMMRDRLTQIRELLAPGGTVWLHLDSMEVHRARCVLDEVFSAANYLGTVVWQRTSAKSLAKRTMGTMHESILVYGASDEAQLRTVYVPLADEYVAKRFTQSDARGIYDTGDLTASSHRPHLDSGKPWRGFDPSSIRRCWAAPVSPLIELGFTSAQLNDLSMLEKLDALDAAGYIHFPDRGGFPRLKKYASRAQGRAVGDLWTDINVINSQASERTGFSTQKPEALIQRVLEMGSQQGDVVLDCFGGSGTTPAVAHKMGRRWIAVERLVETVRSYALPRLAKVVAAEDSGGITASTGWSGGGGFRVLEVAPSMFEADEGLVFLAEGMTNGKLAEVAAAQLGFEYQPEPPFAGRKGRSRLAVVDGVVNSAVVELLVQVLPEQERIVICGTGIDPDARAVLRSLRPGSTLRKIPAALLSEYRSAQAERPVAPARVMATAEAGA